MRKNMAKMEMKVDQLLGIVNNIQSKMSQNDQQLFFLPILGIVMDYNNKDSYDKFLQVCTDRYTATSAYLDPVKLV